MCLAATESWSPSDAPWRGVSWSVTYVAFLWYMAAVTTYNLPGANIAMAVALLGLIVQREPRRFPALLAWFGAFIAWAAVAYPLTRFPEQVQERVTLLAKLWLIALVAVNALRTRRQIRFFIMFFLACYALYPLRGAFVNYFFAGYSLLGRAVWNFIYVNPNDLAALTLLQLSMAVGLLATERPRSWVWVAALAAVVLLSLLVLMTQSRGGVIALALFMVLLIASRRRRPLVVVAAGALAVSVALLAPAGVWTRMSGLSKVASTADLRQADPEGSAKGRFDIWRVAVKIIRDQPVLGVGAGAYHLAHASYARDDEFGLAVRGKRDTHSTVLNVLAETGVPGLMLFLALLLTTAWKAERIRRACRATLPRESARLLYLEFGLVAFLVAGVFGSFAHLAFLYVHLALTWAAAEACRRDVSARRPPGQWTRS
ncbi:MAG: O-antigen ligase family protein [Gemmatimonadota bacterium]|nr:O-antigen ligase family protein [Gemmatimonadota bacterium]